MTDLEELIQYWKDNLALNYVNRTPLANQLIENTIVYLTDLKNIYKRQRLLA